MIMHMKIKGQSSKLTQATFKLSGRRELTYAVCGVCGIKNRSLWATTHRRSLLVLTQVTTWIRVAGVTWRFVKPVLRSGGKRISRMNDNRCVILVMKLTAWIVGIFYSSIISFTLLLNLCYTDIALVLNPTLVLHSALVLHPTLVLNPTLVLHLTLVLHPTLVLNSALVLQPAIAC